MDKYEKRLPKNKKEKKALDVVTDGRNGTKLKEEKPKPRKINILERRKLTKNFKD